MPENDYEQEDVRLVRHVKYEVWEQNTDPVLAPVGAWLFAAYRETEHGDDAMRQAREHAREMNAAYHVEGETPLARWSVVKVTEQREEVSLEPQVIVAESTHTGMLDASIAEHVLQNRETLR